MSKAWKAYAIKIEIIGKAPEDILNELEEILR